LVLKPQASRLYHQNAGIDSFTVAYADGPERLAEQMAQFEGRCPVLLQEYCAGAGDGVELLLHEGRPLAAFQHRRLREVPITGGASAFRESVPLDPLLLDYSTRLLRELRWTGLAMVEFKSSAGGPRLMEINGRVWGSLPLAVRSGMDFPRHLAELTLNGPPPDGELDTSYRVGVRARNLKLDLVWIANVLLGRKHYSFLPAPRRTQAITALLELFHPRLKSDVFMLEDPWPGVAELRDVVRTFRGKLREAG
jgi:predicted ATP-grasp superfamily ATP-dependent carboligase